MERRQFLGGAALLSATLIKAGPLHAAEKEFSSPLLVRSPEALKALAHFTEVATTCTTKGEICVQYATEQLANENVNFGNCAIASSQMVVLCGAVAKLATMKSVRVRELLDACATACKACKEACEEHKAHWKHGMHLECKECAEQCEKMIREVAVLKTGLGK